MVQESEGRSREALETELQQLHKQARFNQHDACSRGRDFVRSADPAVLSDQAFENCWELSGVSGDLTRGDNDNDNAGSGN
jgi:hypothetical protein